MSRLKTWVSKIRKENRDLNDAVKKEKFEKNDTFAIILAAFITIFPVVLAIMAVFMLLMWLIFGR